MMFSSIKGATLYPSRVVRRRNQPLQRALSEPALMASFRQQVRSNSDDPLASFSFPSSSSRGRRRSTPDWNRLNVNNKMSDTRISHKRD